MLSAAMPVDTLPCPPVAEQAKPERHNSLKRNHSTVLLDLLLGSKAIDGMQHSYGMQLSTLHHIALSKNGYRVNSMYDTAFDPDEVQDEEEDESQAEAAEMSSCDSPSVYFKVMALFSKSQQEMLNLICFRDDVPHLLKELHKPAIAKLFDAVGEALYAVRGELMDNWDKNKY